MFIVCVLCNSWYFLSGDFKVFVADLALGARLPAWVSLVAQMVKNPPANAGEAGWIPGSGRSWRRAWQPTPAFLPGASQGQRGLEGHSPWGCKELDMTECLSTHTPCPQGLSKDHSVVGSVSIIRHRIIFRVRRG